MTLGPLMIDVAGLSLTPEEAMQLEDSRIGGVILFSRNFESTSQLKELVDSIHAVRMPQLLVAVDQEGGRVQRFRQGFSELPTAHWLGHQYDIDSKAGRKLARLCGWLMAAELLEVGIDLSFAPVVDLDFGLSEVIGDRAIHKNPNVVASIAVAYMQGMRDAGMMAVAKHFPGHGAVIADSHLELPEDHRNYDGIEDDLIPYRRLIDNGLQGVMMAHVRYPAVDRRIASLSPFWIQTQLRDMLGFSGAVFSDDLNMSATFGIGDMTTRVRKTLDAGADMALICNNPAAVTQTLEELGDIGSPSSQVRLVALRPHAPAWKLGSLRVTAEWKAATVGILDAGGPPSLVLNG
ncbi:MAG: beta-N-acetylhexosaminidase [Gammaproteobacteria bacterium]|nr:beta-N-acetylhexosaminidase [Gammaproteobacteria bacterium]